ELRVADQVSMDCNRADDANRPAFLFHLGDVVYSFGEAQYYYAISSTSRSEAIRLRSSPFRAITTPSSSRAPLRLNTPSTYSPPQLPPPPARHPPRGRPPASPRHDPAGRLFRPRCAIRARHRAVQQLVGRPRPHLQPGRSLGRCSRLSIGFSHSAAQAD